MDENLRENIFEPFHHHDSTLQHKKGGAGMENMRKSEECMDVCRIYSSDVYTVVFTLKKLPF